MNFLSRRLLCGIKRSYPLTINQTADKGRICIVLNHPGHVPIRSKMRLPNSSIFLFREKTKEHSYDSSNNTIDSYGYVLLGIPILTFLLGTWQVYRRQWKLGLIEDMQNRTSADPIELPKNLDELAAIEFCPVRVKGTFLHDKEFTIGPRPLILNGGAVGENSPGFITANTTRGYWLVTPFKLADRDLTILVNRGWIPDNYKKPQKRKELQVEGTVDIVGLVRMTEKRNPFVIKNVPERGLWNYRDLNEMSEYAGTAPVFIDQVADNKYAAYPIAGQTRVTLRNEHLTYVFTWYSLSAITSYLWYRNFIQRAIIL